MSRHLFLHLTIPAVITSVLLLAIGVVAAWLVQQWQTRVSRVLQENVSAMRAAGELEIRVQELRTSLEHFRTSGDPQHREAMRGLRTEMEHWVIEAVRWSNSPREDELVAQARQGWEKWWEDLDRITDHPPAQRQSDCERLEDVLTREIQAPTHAFLVVNEEEAEQSVRDTQISAGWLVFGLLLVGTCGGGAGLVTGFALARRFIERLQRSERAALHAEQLAALGHLAAGMAHELRNPITTIKILVQAALMENEFGACDEGHSFFVPGLAGRDLNVVEEEITRLEGFVQSFLDFGRPPLLERRVVEVCALVQQTLEVVAGRAAAADVTVAFTSSAKSIHMVLDPGQFRQVVLNLVLNALDAVKAGGRIDVRLEQDPQGTLRLQVADNGCGLPPKLGSRIFEPFTTSKDTGLGLGLSICKRIAEAHGGTITGTNRVEGGAVFVVSLPVPGPGGKSGSSISP